MFTLRVFMTGLCLFRERDDGSVEVLLVNDGNLEFEGPDHTPVLQFDLIPGQVELHNHIEIIPFHEKNRLCRPTNRKKGLWLIDHEDLFIEPDEGFSSDNLELVTEIDVQEEAAKLAQAAIANGNDPSHDVMPGLFPAPDIPGEGVEWIWPIAGENGEEPDFKTSVIQRDQETVRENFIKGAVILNNGSLKTARHCTTINTYVLWTDNPSSGICRAMTAVVVYEVGIKGRHVDFVGANYGSGVRRAVRLRPAGSSNVVETWIMNRNLENIITQRPLPNVTEREQGEDKRMLTVPISPFPEYMSYYRLMNNPPVEPVLPRWYQENVIPARFPDDPTFFEDPCRDPSMRRIFFRQPDDGQNENSAVIPCDPVIWRKND